MSMLKTVPDGLKARECKRVKLRKLLPVIYVPVKDEVQEEVARMCSMEIKTTKKKRYYDELLCVARKRDLQSFFDARDCSVRCN